MAKPLEKSAPSRKSYIYLSQLENISWVYSTYVAHRSDCS